MIKKFGPRAIDYYGDKCQITATVRYTDYFSITGEIRNPRLRRDGGIVVCGCLHDDIAKAFPELAPLIKWHLCSNDGPSHYVANTLYHADEHGPNRAWVYFTGHIDPFKLAGTKERLLGYFKPDEVAKVEGQPGYRVQWDEKTAKTADLDAARRCAIWPEATDDELRSPCLQQLLEGRLPALLEEFRQAVAGVFEGVASE